MINKKNILKYLGILSIIFFLYGCYGSYSNKTPNTEVISHEKAISNIIHTGAQNHPGSLTGILNQEVITKREVSRYGTGFIDNINSLDSLLSFNPKLKNDPGVSHPKFLELQKKIMLFNDLSIKLQNKNLNNLRMKEADIFQGRAIWKDDLVLLDRTIQETIGSGVTTSSGRVEVQSLLDKKNNLLLQLKQTKEFKEYLVSQSGAIQNINGEILQYSTPEMISLKKDIDKLSSEIYGVTD